MVTGHRVVSVRAPLDRALAADAVRLLRELVASGAALGWVEPPSSAEVLALLAQVQGEAARGDAALVVASTGAVDDEAGLAGLGYWRRYERPTHRVHADLEKVAVDPRHQGHGLGRALVTALVGAARDVGVEVLTLDVRGDNAVAVGLYESLGFVRYGRLERFVAVGEARYDKLFYALDLRVGHDV